jgi:hypothetical protein
MPVTFDAAASDSAGFSASLTFSHTCGGTDRVLFVAVVCGNNRTISGVTYDGVSMSAVESGSDFMRLFALVNPASGANDVVVTTSQEDPILAVSTSYSGVDQSTPYDGVQVATTGDNTPSVTVASAEGNRVVGMDVKVDFTDQSIQTPNTGQTSRGNEIVTFFYIDLSDKAGEASTAFGYTRNGDTYFHQRLIAVNVIAASEPPPPATPGDLADFTGGSPFILNQFPSTGNLMVITDA